MQIKFWGVRGSIATPGKNTSIVGGNTSCVEVTHGGQRLILDGGTGLRALGGKLSKSGVREYHVLISHFHFDHICGLPFFEPLYQNTSRIHFYGPKGLKSTLRQTLSAIFTKNYFPVPFDKLPAKLSFHTLKNSSFRIGPFAIESLLLNHPGKTLGFRITVNQKSFVYLTDNEPILGHNHMGQGKAADYQKNLGDFIDQANLLIHDAHFLDHEYEKFKGWGHSPWGQALKMARDHHIKTLVLFHFAPNHSDKLLKNQLKKRIQKNKSGRPFKILIAREGRVLPI